MRLDTVVVGIDFSSAAIATANWAAKSLAPRAKLALVHALELPARPPFLVAETLPAEALEIEARTEAMDRLRKVARELGPNVTRVELRSGRAADVITQFAIDASADLVVVGPHGNRAHRSRLLGTTADALVRAALVPVLVGPHASMRGRTRVIAGVTETTITARILSWADYAARQLGGRLTALHAIETAGYVHMASMAAAHAHGDPVAEWLEIDEERRGQALHWLTECSRAHIDTSHVDAVAQEGEVAEVIVLYAAKERAALVVLGKHENAPGVPSRLGSTVRHVLHDARCAVLVIPPP